MMLACSRLTFVLLTVAVPCALAQHAPPVSELLTKARRVVCRGAGRRCARGGERVGVGNTRSGPHPYWDLWFPAPGFGRTPPPQLIRYNWRKNIF